MTLVRPAVTGFFDETTYTASFVVSDPETGEAAVIDPVLDYDPVTGRVGGPSADRIASYLLAQKLTVEWILETHIHSDHLTAAAFLKRRFGGRSGAGIGAKAVQDHFASLFDPDTDAADSPCFDRLFADDERLELGGLSISVLMTPGHTPACVTYLIGECAFVGDALLMPGYGTARCDFPGGGCPHFVQVDKADSRTSGEHESVRLP